MKKFIAIIAFSFLFSASAFSDGKSYYPYDSSYDKRSYINYGTRQNSSYPGCDTCGLKILQGDSQASRMLRNEMWRMETGHGYYDYDRRIRY